MARRPDLKGKLMKLQGEIVKRPTGQGWFVVAVISGCVAVLSFLLVLGMGEQSYGVIDPDPRSWRLLLILVSEYAMGLALFATAIGSILRALWFLPGEEEKTLPAPTGSHET